MNKSSYYIDITSKYFNKRISIAPFHIISTCMIPQNPLKRFRLCTMVRLWSSVLILKISSICLSLNHSTWNCFNFSFNVMYTLLQQHLSLTDFYIESYICFTCLTTYWIYFLCSLWDYIYTHICIYVHIYVCINAFESHFNLVYPELLII